MRLAFYRHFEQANQASASLNWQSSSSVFVDQAGDKSRAVLHLARDAEGNPKCRVIPSGECICSVGSAVLTKDKGYNGN
jgi:hypothetical protein